MNGTKLAIAALALGAWLAPAVAQENTLRFNHVLAPTEPYHEGFLDWAKRVEERTNGGLKIEVFNSAQLGVERTSSSKFARAPISARTRMRRGSETMSP